MIARGCQPAQREVLARLGDVAAAVEAAALPAPALIVVGAVVDLAACRDMALRLAA